MTAYNAKVRQNRARRKTEVERLNRALQRSGVNTTRHSSSVVNLQRSFANLEESGVSARLSDELRDLSEGEAANSAAALSALVEEGASAETEDELKKTVIGDELGDLDPDLDARWKGALYALDPRNPDAARHFCTSAREMLDGFCRNLHQTPM